MIKLLIIAFALSVFSTSAIAQDDYDFYLQKARQRIAEGDCSRAEMSYNTFKDLSHKTNKEIEQLIEECKNGGSNAFGNEPTSALGTANGHEWVDLGLPSGTLWATCNVGASKPEDYGSHIAWGETITKSTYSWETYKYAFKLTKYCNKASSGDNGFTDNLIILQSEDDPATAAWGNGWHTPDKKQWDELLNNTTNTWTTQKGVQGRLFTSKKNGQSFFLPAAGLRLYDEFDHVGSYGFYWSSSLYTDNPVSAWRFHFSLGGCNMNQSNRYNGFSIRPVYQKNCTTTTKP